MPFWGELLVAAVIMVGLVGIVVPIPNRTIVVGGLVGIVGFFVVPVIGLLLGFIVGALASELVRTRSVDGAWRGAFSALRAAVKTIGIELLFALIATGIWTGGAFVW